MAHLKPKPTKPKPTGIAGGSVLPTEAFCQQMGLGP